MRFPVILLFTLFSFGIFSQSEEKISINFKLVFGEEKLALEKWYALNENDSIVLENVKFYISGIEFYQGNKQVFQEKNSFHLIDYTDSNSQQIAFNIPEKVKFDELRFNLGIDSLTNSGGVKGGDLDPTTGMYWTWQSGYINCKLEGKSNLCPTRNNAFNFHLGGFSGELNALQHISVKTHLQESMEIKLDLKHFFSKLDLSSENQIMSPGKNAMILSQKIASIFSIQ